MTINVKVIFQARDIPGCHHINGSENGPTLKTIKTINDIRKYHGSFSLGLSLIFRNSPQRLHLIASS